MNNKKIFLKNNVYVLINKVLSMTITFSITVYVTRATTKLEYREFSILVLLTGIFSLLQDLGTSTFIVREISQKRKDAKKIFLNTVFGKILIGLFFYFFFVSLPAILGYSQEIQTLSYLFGIAMLFQSFLLSVIKYYQGLEQMSSSLLVTISERIFTLILLISFSYFFNLIIAFVLAIILSNSLVFLFNFFKNFRLNEIIKNIDFVLIKKIFLSSRLFLLVSIISILYTKFDFFFISLKLPKSNAATFRANIQLIDAINIIAVNLGVAFLPFFSRLIIEERIFLEKLYSTLFKKIFYFSLFTTITIFFNSDIIIKLLYPKYYDSHYLLSVISLSIPFYFLNSLNGNMLIALKNEKKLTFAFIIATVIKLTLVVIFIQVYGLMASAIIIVFSEFVSFVIQEFFIHKEKFHIVFVREDMRIILPLMILLLLFLLSKDKFLIFSSFILVGGYIAFDVLKSIKFALKENK